MKTLLVMGLLIVSSSTFASVVKSYDSANDCNLYRVVNETDKALEAGDVLVYPNMVYGLTFENLEVDFDNREARVEIVLNVVLGANKKLGVKVAIAEGNPNFNTLVNQLNRKIKILKNICISQDNKIIYTNLMTKN